MPGFIVHIGEDHFPFPVENRKKLVVGRIEGANYSLERRVVNKFMDDRVFLDDQDAVILVEGVVLNNHQLMDNFSEVCGMMWKQER